MDVGTARIDRNATLDAGTSLAVGDATVAGDAALHAGGNTSGGTLRVGNDAMLASGGTTVFGTIEAGDSIGVDAGADLLADSMNAARGDISVVAGNDITSGNVVAGRDVDFTAGNAIAVGAMQAARNTRLQAGHSVDIDSLVGGGDVRLTSWRSDVTAGDLTAGRDIALDAARQLTVGTADAGRDLTAASNGDQQWGDYSAGNNAFLSSGGSIAMGQGRAGQDQQLIAGDSVAFDTLDAGRAIWIDAKGGDVTGALMEASSADVAASGAIALDWVRVDNRLNLAATDIRAAVEQSAKASGPLTTTLTGYENGVARQIQLEVDARDGWIIDRLQALQADLDTNASQVDIEQGWVGQSMELTTSHAYLWMDNITQRLRSADVQLTQPGNAFQLQQTGVETFTDAYVVRFADGYRVAAPNHNPAHYWGQVEYLGESAIRYTQRMLQPVSARLDEEGDAKKETGAGDVVVGANGSVNMGAPN